VRKVVHDVHLKDAEEGKVRAVVATLGAVDKDGDIITPGAFGTQDVVVSGFNHGSFEGTLPAGRGTVMESGSKAVADLQFFMDTTGGADAFRTIKGLGDLGEWSFGFDIAEGGRRDPTPEERAAGAVRVLTSLEVHEVSPVLLGAGVATGTVSAKCNGCDAPLQRRTRTRKPAPATPQVTALMAAACTNVAKAEAVQRFRQMCVRRHPDPEVQSLALFALKIGHWLAGSMDVLGGKVRPPSLRWFVPAGDGTAGKMWRGDFTTYLSLHLRGRRLVKTALHEARHHGQTDPAAPGMEADAEQFARRWSRAVEDAFRWSGGEPHRVHIRSGRPPFPGRWRTADVVLSKTNATAYHYNRKNKGSAWK